VADYPWLDADFGTVSAVVTFAGAAVLLYRSLRRAPRGYQRLVRARQLERHDLVRRFYRAAWMRHAVVTLLVLILVAADGGVGRRDVGLALPRGRHAASDWGWSLYICVLLAATTVYMRARAKRGQAIPGQRNVVALVARDGERWAAAGVALGAGVSEELLFRGLFTAAVVDVVGLSVGAAVVVVSIGFGLMHVYQGWRGVLVTGLVGFALSALYLSSRSLLMPMLLHVLVDLRGLVAVPVSTGVGGGRRRR